MKVLMFGWEFPPHISGGLGTACYGLTKGLSKHGVKILFVVPKAYGDEDTSALKLLNASDVSIEIKDKTYHTYWKNITLMEVGSNLIPYLSPEEFVRLTDYTAHDRTDIEESVFRRKYAFSGLYGKNLYEEVSRYAIIATEIAKENKYDIIHAHDWLTFPAGIAAKSVNNKPLLIHVHATEFDRSGENINQRVFDIEKMGMEAADRVITVSNYTREIVIERYNINPDKVITVHNAVMPRESDYTTKYKKNISEKVVTFLGRITFQKGPEYFIEAAAKVIRKDKNIRFVMAGSGDMLYRMIRRAARLRISSNFHFTGFLKGEDVDRMYALSDVYVMPSVSEPFGISPLEAMRSNIPVIISKQSGVAEVIPYAIKIDFWDIDAMANAIWGLIHYPALSKMFIRHGKELLDNLKWENAGYKVKELYKEVINGI